MPHLPLSHPRIGMGDIPRFIHVDQNAAISQNLVCVDVVEDGRRQTSRGVGWLGREHVRRLELLHFAFLQKSLIE